MFLFTSYLSLISGMPSWAAAVSLRGKAHLSASAPVGKMYLLEDLVPSSRRDGVNFVPLVQWPRPYHLFGNTGDNLWMSLQSGSLERAVRRGRGE